MATAAQPAWKPLLLGLGLALGLAALFRLAGAQFFLEGRSAANAQALIGAGAGLGAGWLIGRFFGGLQSAVLAALPGLLLMAAITSHFSLAFPAIDPRLDKGFGGLMLWFHGFWLLGGLLTGRRA